MEDHDDAACRKTTLRNVAIFLALWKMITLMCYVLLLTMVAKFRSTGMAGLILVICIFLILPFTISYAAYLVFGALQESVCTIRKTLLMAIGLGIFTSCVGIYGTIYFLRNGKTFVHFILSIIFFCLSFSLCGESNMTTGEKQQHLDHSYKLLLVRDGETQTVLDFSEVEQEAFKKRAIKDGLKAVAYVKLISQFFTLLLICLVYFHSSGNSTVALIVMLITMIPLQIIYCTCLLFGAYREVIFPLTIAFWLCIVIGVLSTIVGIFGAIYFIRITENLIQVIIAIAFIFMCCGICSIFGDIYLIKGLKHILQNEQSNPEQSSRAPPRRAMPPATQNVSTSV